MNRKLQFAKRGKERFKLYFERESFIFEDLVSNKAKFYEGCWQNTRYFELMRSTLRLEIDGSKLLGEDCLGMRQKIEETRSKEYHKKAMAYVKEHTNNPLFYFFLTILNGVRENLVEKRSALFLK